MNQFLKELMAPIPTKGKGPNEIAEEKERRKVRLREVLGVTDLTTDSGYLEILIEEVFLQTDQRGAAKGKRSKSYLPRLRQLVKTSFFTKSGRAKNQDEAAESFGLNRSTFKGLREEDPDRWRYIQEKMSGYAKHEREFRIACEEILAKSTPEKMRLADHRNSLIAEKDKLTAQGIDRTAALDDQILLYEILIARQDDLCRELEDLSEYDFLTIIVDLAERHIVIPPK
ncbi:MAG: hypothetical protein IH838_10435 [Proteobacteria bacterium]|nr:hypothetical protein [Pseudomonadota bacterium]